VRSKESKRHTEGGQNFKSSKISRCRYRGACNALHAFVPPNSERLEDLKFCFFAFGGIAGLKLAASSTPGPRICGVYRLTLRDSSYTSPIFDLRSLSVSQRIMSNEPDRPEDEDRSQGWNFRGHKPENSGRKKGVQNKVTREFKTIVQDLIDENADNVRLWLERVANGVPGEYQTNQEGQRETVRFPIAADPARAVDLIGRLAEYVAPKLTRTEVTGPGGQPLAPPVLRVTIEGKAGEPESDT